MSQTQKRNGNISSYKEIQCLTNKEYDTIKHEASLLGISLAMFTRWCAVHVAANLTKHRKARSTSMYIGEEEIELPKSTTNKRKGSTAKSK